MKTKLTSEDINLLQNANRAVMGTDKYTKYYMETSCKYPVDGGWSNWVFTGWGVVYTKTAEIKKIRGSVYIVSKDMSGPVRWKVTDAVNELLKIY